MSIKKTLLTFILSSFLILPIAARATTGIQDLQTNTQNFGAATGLGSEVSAKTLPEKVANIINIVLGVLGIVAVVIIIYAGFRWMMAGGNDDIVREAKSTLRNGLIGLVIIFLSYAIANFVVSQLSDATSSGGGETMTGQSQH